MSNDLTGNIIANKKKFIFAAITLFLFLLLNGVYYFVIKKKLKQVSVVEFKYQSKIVNDRVVKFLNDVSTFLYFTKKNLEKDLEIAKHSSSLLKKYDRIYTSTKRNLVSNYNFVITNRKNSNKISATYLSKNEILTNDIKKITVITADLDNFWSKLSEEYPFLSMTYVDKTGLYREFPFRKIEPMNIGFLSDARNYPYYSTATTVSKDEIFITLPYKVRKNLYVSFVIPVYEKDSFRGLLTLDISMEKFKKMLYSFQSGIKDKLLDVVLYDKKGIMYFYSFEEDASKLINYKNLNEVLSKQNTIVSKNIKLYPLIKSGNLIATIENFLSSSKKEQTTSVDGFFVYQLKTSKFNLNIFSFKKENLLSSQGVINEFKKSVGISFILFMLLLLITFGYSSGTICNLNELLSTFSERIKNESLKKRLTEREYIWENPEKMKALGERISEIISTTDRENKLLNRVANSVNFGILVIKEGENDDEILFANKWFKQLIVDAKTIDLLPENLTGEIKKFKDSNLQQYQKMLKLFERHYLVKAEKISSYYGSKDNIIVISVSNAENLNKLEIENKELRDKINELEKNLSDFNSSFEHLNTKIIQSDKFAVFGELIQGIVHNINNPMMIVTSRLSMVKSIIESMDDSLEKKRLLKHITNIISSLKKINEIIDSVLLKAKITVEREEKLVDVNELIKTELEFFNADLFFKHKVEKQILLENNLPFVRISQSDFSQVLHNIIKNALDVLKAVPNPTLTLKTYLRDNKVVIEVEDNGPGIPDHLKEKIFEQYFTTKGSHGTGIGLFNSRKIIEEYDGQLIVEDSKSGAKFVIILPSAGGE